MKEIILETKFVNEFGETMTLRLDEDHTQWFHHNDCSEDFEKIEDLRKNEPVNGIEIKFKYVLDNTERIILWAFEDTCDVMKREREIIISKI